MKELRDFFKKFSDERYGVSCYMDAEGKIYFQAYDKWEDNHYICGCSSKSITVEGAQALLREFNK